MNERRIVDRMQALVERWEAEADQRAIFLGCYKLMTRNVLRGVDAGRFADAGWVSALLAHFADYYWEALRDYRQEERVPEPWRLAFDAARHNHVSPVQHMLLGVNAHISYDLVFALADMLRSEWATAGAGLRQRRYQDYCLVNRILAETIDEVQDTVLEPHSRLMALLDVMMGPMDEWLASRLIGEWREGVWEFSMRWLDQVDDEGRKSVARQVEAVAIRRAQLLLAGAA